MDTTTILDEAQLRIILTRAHLGDASARDEYKSLIKEARGKGDEFRVLYLYYVREVTLRELLEEYVEGLEFEDIWLISDTHFNHRNIIKYCNRPFESVEAMNEALFCNWQEAVSPDDTVYMLGDIAFGGRLSRVRWLKRLSGRILLVKGSHDNISWAPLYRLVHWGGKDILLIHNPADIPTWWNGWTIHGHLHNQTPFIDHKTRRVNVSVEVTDYKPVNLTDILLEINKV